MTDKPKDKVIITSRPSRNCDGYYIGEATTEEGRLMAEHASSSLEWSKIDMLSPFKLAKYAEYFPHEFEIIFNGETVGKFRPHKQLHIFETMKDKVFLLIVIITWMSIVQLIVNWIWQG